MSQSLTIGLSRSNLHSDSKTADLDVNSLYDAPKSLQNGLEMLYKSLARSKWSEACLRFRKFERILVARDVQIEFDVRISVTSRADGPIVRNLTATTSPTPWNLCTIPIHVWMVHHSATISRNQVTVPHNTIWKCASWWQITAVLGQVLDTSLHQFFNSDVPIHQDTARDTIVLTVLNCDKHFRVEASRCHHSTRLPTIQFIYIWWEQISLSLQTLRSLCVRKTIDKLETSTVTQFAYDHVMRSNLRTRFLPFQFLNTNLVR